MKIFDFKLGADPELQLLRRGVLVQAQDAVSCAFNDYRREGMGFDIPGAGVVGWDGASSPAELRPNPTNDPEEAVRNIGTLLAELHKRLPGIDVTTLSLNCRVGGHIQVDFPNKLLKNEKVKNRIELLMATFVLPLFCADHPMSSNYRRHDYGNADDFRTEMRNRDLNLTTFEIRGPSAEWLVSPKVSMATLSYIGVVWTEVLKHHETLIRHKDVFKSAAQISGVQGAVLSGYLPVQTMLMRKIHDVVRTFSRYQDFREEIDFILSPRRVMAHKQALKWLPKNGWKLPQPKVATKRQVLSPSADVLAETAFIDRTYGQPYNDDLNVKALMQLLARRTYTANLNFTHDYFFYGLRKGMNTHLVATFEKDGNQQKVELLQKPAALRFKDALNTASRMGARVHGQSGGAAAQRFDAQTAKLVPLTYKCILVGIPYEERKAITDEESALKPFLTLMRLIWKLEHEPLVSLQPGPEEAQEEKFLTESLTSAISVLSDLESTLSVNELQPCAA